MADADDEREHRQGGKRRGQQWAEVGRPGETDGTVGGMLKWDKEEKACRRHGDRNSERAPPDSDRNGDEHADGCERGHHERHSRTIDHEEDGTHSGPEASERS